ncbi:fumarylacetoacetate hydrolase family protein [Stygiolobus caldivivus]|uniref:2-hydroxyhepta-2,4-diene-1,7-dioate isomerase n=1 Tax=Stygiolobus caldivivus TaxID=2824673 RepID=A0A8D5U9J3_9CREN|nr:fumarylacetoacetate hydrolase family protein [Stygiolobus caldivivus]BCU71555.1 2-hydroxyhepta-2,4-diene-1,7-dioate isomerase [Stygiolobus caldivivus]
MKYVSFMKDGSKRFGILEGDRVFEVDSLEEKEPKGSSYKLSELVLHAPVPQREIICTLTNSPKMVGVDSKEKARELLFSPKFFIKLSWTIIGPYDTVISPKSGIRPEVEIAVVTKKKLKNSTPAEARDAVLGYTVFNDVTAPNEFKKDWYKAFRRDPNDGKVKEMTVRGNHFRNKNRDTFSPMGPWLVTQDELTDPYGLRMRSQINDEVIQEGSSDELVFSIEEILTELSKILTLPKYSIVSTGTIGYFGAEDPSEFKPKNCEGTMIAEVDKIGKIVNKVVVEQST